MVLKHLTYQLKWQLTDTLYARLCGGEFAILFDALDAKGAESRLLQLQKNLKSNPLQIDQQMILVEISIGFACFPHDGKEGEVLARMAANRMRSARNLANGYITETDERQSSYLDLIEQ